MSAIPDRAIRLAYLWPCNAAMAAVNLNHHYGTKLTAEQLKRRWRQEYETCAPLRALGVRPEMGFRVSDEVKLVERLVA